MITTRIIRLTPAGYVRIAFGIWLSRWWWALLVPILVLALLGLGDAMYFIAILALICIVYPGVLMLIYFNHALRPEAAFSTLPHTISACAEGLNITYFSPSDDVKCPAPRLVPVDSIATVEDNGTSLLFTLKSGRYDFIEVPLEAIPDGDRGDFLIFFTNLLA